MISTIAFVILLTAIIVQIVFLLIKKDDNISLWLVLPSSVLLLVNIVIRSIEIKFVAITNTFESLVFFSGIILLTVFVYKFKWKDKAYSFIIFGGSIVAAILLAIASSPIAPDKVAPPIPALQSNWLTLHVVFSFIGEAFFVVAFIASIYYLASKNGEKKKNLDRITYTAIAIGYPIYTAGALIFGAIWASNAWGRFWSWDPKEIWALVTWFVYTVYLHCRYIKGFRGKVTSWLSILGFALTIFTFFGVNYLLSGLHSYG